MKSYGETVAQPRMCLPILDEFPSNPVKGELIYFNKQPDQGVYFFGEIGWIQLFVTENNIWETQIAEPEQVMFRLSNDYNTDGKSIVVYKDGVRLKPIEYVEVGRNFVAWKGDELLGGEQFEFQIFNVKRNGTFSLKDFNRRV